MPCPQKNNSREVIKVNFTRSAVCGHWREAGEEKTEDGVNCV
jgi:hypothetical protein